MNKILLTIVALLAFVLPARAEDVTIKLTPEQNTIIIKQHPNDSRPLMAAPTGVEAVGYATGPYFLLQGGVYGPSNGSGEHYSAYETNPGFAADLVLGYRLNPMWSLQMDLGYQGSEGLAGFNYMAMPITGAVRFGLPAGMFEPYVLAGGGAYFIKTTLNEGAESIDEVQIGGYAGAGALIHFENKMMAGVEVRYQMLNTGNAPNDGLLLFGGVGYQY